MNEKLENTTKESGLKTLTYYQTEMFPTMISQKTLDPRALVIAICNEMFHHGMVKIPHVLVEKDIFLQLLQKLLNLVHAEKRFGVIDVNSIDIQELYSLLEDYCVEHEVIACMELKTLIPIVFLSPPSGIERLAKEMVELIIPSAR
jgi:hypothetical protein